MNEKLTSNQLYINQETLIKSKERVRSHGEVFTPTPLVAEMCDILPAEMFMPEKKFLEPSCGNGNFLAEILRRKLDNSNTWMDALTAAGSLYGIDILEDNVMECRRRLLEAAVGKLVALGVEKNGLALIMKALENILKRNIVRGDFLNPHGIWFLPQGIGEKTNK